MERTVGSKCQQASAPWYDLSAALKRPEGQSLQISLCWYHPALLSTGSGVSGFIFLHASQKAIGWNFIGTQLQS